MPSDWKVMSYDCRPEFKKPFLTRAFHDTYYYWAWVIHSPDLVENLSSGDDTKLAYLTGVDWCYVPD